MCFLTISPINSTLYFVNKVLDSKIWKPVFLSKYDASLIQHTQVWGWNSDHVVAVYQETGANFCLDAFGDGTVVGIWKNKKSNNQKFTRVMSGKLGKYDLC